LEGKKEEADDGEKRELHEHIFGLVRSAVSLTRSYPNSWNKNPVDFGQRGKPVRII